MARVFTRKVDGPKQFIHAQHINELQETIEVLTQQVFNVKESTFGTVGDGVTDDTTAIQAAINAAIAAVGGVVFFPAGTYRITSALNVPRTYGWAILGSGRETTIIVQDTDNTPIFNLGSDTSSSMHSWRIAHLKLTYTNVQPAANTLSVPIYFNDTGYEGEITDIDFQRGSYGIKVKSGVISFWGCTFDRLWFSSELTIGAIDNNTGTGGIPNNVWGHFIVDANNMIGPIFNAKGYNFKIGTIEIIGAFQGPQLFNFAAGAEVFIEAVKLELGTYSATQTLIQTSANSLLHIGMFSVGGTAVTIGAGVTLSAIAYGAGGGGAACTVDFLRLGAPGNSGTFYAFGSSGGVGRVRRAVFSNGVILSNNSSHVTNETMIVDEYLNHRLSADKGDADYTVALGDPNIIMFQTAFTAQRTVTLPAVGNNLHNGLFYEIVVNGAVNGANTLVIKAGATTLRTQTTDKAVLRYTWRRNVTASAGWVLTKHEELGSGTSVSADNGDAAKTITVGTDVEVQRWNTPLTAARAVTLSTTGAYNGAKFRIVRTAAATGAFNLNVGTGPLKALAAGQWCDVAFDGTAWMLTGFGSL